MQSPLPPHFLLWFISLIVLVALIEAILKGIGLWRASRNNQVWWFVVLFILNTAGILPLIYLLAVDKRNKVA